MPPIKGVHVLFRLYADSNNPNSVCEVPSCWCSWLFRGPRILTALRDVRESLLILQSIRTNDFQCSRNMRIRGPQLAQKSFPLFQSASVHVSPLPPQSLL